MQKPTERKTHITTADTAAGRSNAEPDVDWQGNTITPRQKYYLNFQYFS